MLTSHTGDNVRTADPTVDFEYVGAVPAFWQDDHDGPLSVVLSFRIGEADERLGTRGGCQLLCRIAIADIDDPNVTVTPSITTLRTTFTITGADDAVARVTTTIARAIATLRTDTAEQTAAQILAEWNPLDRWDVTLMSLRFGCRGYGLGAFPLLGLRHLDVTAFSEWARTWFTAHNAVLSANRRPPDTLDLGALGDGLRKSVPDPHQIDRVLPAVGTGPAGQLAVSLLTRFDATVELAMELLVHRIEERCRRLGDDIGTPQLVVRRTGVELATIAMKIEAPDDRIDTLHASLGAEFFTFAMNGPDQQELDDARLKVRRGNRTSFSGRGTVAERLAEDELFGEDRDLETALTVKPDDLASVVRDLMLRGIWLVPEGVTLSDKRLVSVTAKIEPVDDGQLYSPLPNATNPRDTRRLAVATHAMTLFDDASSCTVRFADLVALERERDGTRVLWSDDGTSLVFRPADWQSGQELCAWIDSRVEPWIILDPPDDTDDQTEPSATIP